MPSNAAFASAIEEATARLDTYSEMLQRLRAGEGGRASAVEDRLASVQGLANHFIRNACFALGVLPPLLPVTTSRPQPAKPIEEEPFGFATFEASANAAFLAEHETALREQREQVSRLRQHGDEKRLPTNGFTEP